MTEHPRIVIAGGGTGGHVFPGLAVAEAMGRLADVEVIFCGSPRGLESTVVPPRGYRLELLDVRPMKGGGVTRAVRGALVAARATVQALALLRRLAPRVVLSVGGYAAGPVSLAAVLTRVKLAAFEPNAAVGLTNRILAPFAARAYLSWPEAKAPFRQDATLLSGVPLRAGFGPRPYVAGSTARVLVLGGSQGAAALNERLPRAVARARASVPDLEVLHQAGKERDAEVVEAYRRAGVERARVVPFLDDVAQEIARADVVVARSGAGTVAEICAVGRAAIFVPFPFAADDHQAKNAESLAARGGAVVLRQECADEARLSAELTALLADAGRRTRIALAAQAAGHPFAASEVAKDLLSLAGVPLARKAGRVNGVHREEAR